MPSTDTLHNPQGYASWKLQEIFQESLI